MAAKIITLAACAMTVAATATSALADEGMWTFDNFPADKVMAAYGVAITPAWLDHVRGAAVRLTNGCSASIVSSHGLVFTNNHCVAPCAQDLSSPTNDYYSQGYLATALSDEKTCAGVQAEILTAISDVTSRVVDAGKGLAGDMLVKAQTATSSQIEKETCPDDKRYRCEVVNLYHGGQYKLYRYRKYSDVRLVFSPGITASSFGGDPDNFNFPRYNYDIAFLRLYEDGKAVNTPDHLTWNSRPPRDGEPVFVAGNPGKTDRELTVSELETQRDIYLPLATQSISEVRGRLIRFGEESAENKRISRDDLHEYENSYKFFIGMLSALQDPHLIASKRREEETLKAEVPHLKGLPADFGDPWRSIEQIQGSYAALLLPKHYLAPASVSDLFDYGQVLVRAAAERTKPSAERLPGYADSQLPLLQKEVLDPAPIFASLEQLLLEFWLSKAREHLTADSPYTKLLLGSDSPEDLSAALAQSKLGDPAVRKALWDGGEKAIEASQDPMILFVRKIDPEARKILTAYNEQVSGPTAAAAEKIAKARFAAFGTTLYPDATFTLRLSYGKISGWTYRGTHVASMTMTSGLYARATGKPPFDLDPRWVAAKSSLNPNTVFNIATTNDVTGGNSGSPVINAKGEVIGALFDGNSHSMGGDYGYDGALNRSIVVSTAVASEGLMKVYHAKALERELEGITVTGAEGHDAATSGVPGAPHE